MPRIKIPTIGEAPAASQPILENVRRALGFVPNVQHLMPISPPALAGWVRRACQDLRKGTAAEAYSPTRLMASWSCQRVHLVDRFGRGR